MAPRKFPEADDRGQAAIDKPKADVIDLDAERRKREQMTLDTSANNEPAEPGSDGGGAQNEPI